MTQATNGMLDLHIGEEVQAKAITTEENEQFDKDDSSSVAGTQISLENVTPEAIEAINALLRNTEAENAQLRSANAQLLDKLQEFTEANAELAEELKQARSETHKAFNQRDNAITERDEAKRNFNKIEIELQKVNISKRLLEGDVIERSKYNTVSDEKRELATQLEKANNEIDYLRTRDVISLSDHNSIVFDLREQSEKQQVQILNLAGQVKLLDDSNWAAIDRKWKKHKKHEMARNSRLDEIDFAVYRFPIGTEKQVLPNFYLIEGKGKSFWNKMFAQSIFIRGVTKWEYLGIHQATAVYGATFRPASQDNAIPRSRFNADGGGSKGPLRAMLKKGEPNYFIISVHGATFHMRKNVILHLETTFSKMGLSIPPQSVIDKYLKED